MDVGAEPDDLTDIKYLVRFRRHYKVLSYITKIIQSFGSKLTTEPSVYERLLTVKRIRRELGHYDITISTLDELIEADYVERITGVSGLTIFMPTSEGRLYLQGLRDDFERIKKRIARFSSHD